MPDEAKQYAEGAYCKEIAFNSGKTLMKVSLRLDKFIEWAKTRTNERGYINLGISKRSSGADKNGNTHSMWLDTWKPQQGYTPKPQEPVVEKMPDPENPHEDPAADMPF